MTRGAGLRAHVCVVTKLVRQKVGKIDDNISQRLRTLGKSTSGGTSIGNVVEISVNSVITVLIERIVVDTVATEWNSAVFSARIGVGVTVEGSIVALLHAVCDTISTNRLDTVGSTGIWLVVRIVHSIVTLLISILDTVAALQSTGRGTSVSREEIAIVAFLTAPWVDNTVTTNWDLTISANRGIFSITGFTIVLDTVTTRGEAAVGAASIGNSVIIHGTIVTFLSILDNTVSTCNAAIRGTKASRLSVADTTLIALFVYQLVVERSSLALIDDTISAPGPAAVSSASSRFIVGVVWSIIALLSGVDSAIATLEVTLEATVIGDCISIITLLSEAGINNTVSAARKRAVRSALVGLCDAKGVQAVVALFGSVNDIVSTSWKGAVSAAGSLRCISIILSLVATLTGIDASVATLALAELITSISGNSVSVITLLWPNFNGNGDEVLVQSS